MEGSPSSPNWAPALVRRNFRIDLFSAIAGLAAAALAGAFIDVVPAAWVFAAVAAIGLPGSLAFFAVRHAGPDVPVARRSVAAIARGVWADHRYRRLLLCFSVFGVGNLMNVAVYPILLVDHFNAPNSFVGAMSAVQSATMIAAYL